jgi:N-acetylneuraminic acid mutarotase
MHTMSATMIRRRIALFTLLLASFLAACGGGGGGGGSGTSPPPLAAPSDLKYPAAPAFVVDTAITPLTPTVTGTVTSYGVSPGLPAGLSLNTTTGVISGTPTSAAAEASYTVKASNAAGSTTASVSIEVAMPSTGAPSGLNYPTPPAFVVNTAITALTPTVTGTVTSYSVSPALPAGLNLSTTTGVISGTPTAAAAKASYVVKATNSVGSTTAVVSIVVEAATSAGLTITSQPTSISVPAGATATLKVAATGNGTLSYQWYTVSFGSSGTSYSTPVTGATAATLTLTANAATANTYDCVVTDTLSDGSKATATSVIATLSVTPSTVSAAVTADNWVSPNTAGLVASVTAHSGATYTWSVSNGGITAGQGTPQITYTSGSLGPLQITATVTAQLAGSATGVKNVVVVATLPMASIFAQSSVLPGAMGVLASTPSLTGGSYAWSLQNGTASATSTGSTATDVLTYSVGSTPGSYQLSVNVTDSGGNSASAQRSASVVQGTFIKDVRDMAQRSLHTATLLNDGRVLVAGGDAGIPTFAFIGFTYLPTVGSLSNIVATSEVFDPVTSTWAMVGSLTTARAQHTATRLNDGRVLVAGGVDASGGALASTEIYDPATQSWSAGPPMSVARDLPSATLLADGRVLISGGANGNDLVGTAEIYDPIANAWSGAGTMVVPRAEHSATLLADGRVLAVGGLTSLGGAQTVSAEIYDPTANNWQSAAAPPGSGALVGAVRLPSGGVLLTTGEIYDPSTNTWVASSPPCGQFTQCAGAPNDATSAILLPNGTVLAAGGTIEPEIYDPVMQAWAATNAPALATQTLYSFFSIGIYGSVTGLQNGDVLAEGGIVDTEGEYVSPPSNSISIGVLFDPTQSSWSLLGSQAHAGSYAASGVLGNGKVLVTGGFNLFIQQLADLFDTATNTWSPAAPMLHYRQQHTATVLQSGQMLVTGGLTTNIPGPTNTAELYDPASNAWTSAGFMSTPRYQDTASLLGNGTVLVVGGNDGDTCTCTTFLGSADLYNPTTNSFTATGPLNTARYAHTATVLANGKVLVTGGFGGATSTIQTGGAALASAELYDPTAGTWTATGSMNSPRMNHTATLLPSGKVLVAGGSTGAATTASAEMYDPSSGTWTLVAPMATPRQSQGAVALSNGTVLVVGGLNDASSAVIGVGTLEVYDPTSNTWTTSGAMVTTRQSFVLNTLGDGRILLDGGMPDTTGLPEFFR